MTAKHDFFCPALKTWHSAPLNLVDGPCPVFFIQGSLPLGSTFLHFSLNKLLVVIISVH